MNTVKKKIKRNIQHFISIVGKHNWSVSNDSLLILMYHRIIPSDCPDINIIQPGMMVSPETFRLHVRLLKKYFDLIKLDQWIDDSRNNRDLPRKACAITFDDGWRDNYEYAFPILKEEGAPASIFLVSDLIGTNKSFWPERLARIIWNNKDNLQALLSSNNEFNWLKPFIQPYIGESITRETIDQVITDIKSLSDSFIEQKLSTMEQSALNQSYDTVPDLLDWQQVKDMHESGLISFGSHTRHHKRLNDGLDGDKMIDEIKNSKSMIESHLGKEIDLFCYPNGDTCSQATKYVKQYYAGSCTTKIGWNNKHSNPYELRRIAIHQDIAYDEISFLARLSGWI